jgi:hypothetical protein
MLSLDFSQAVALFSFLFILGFLALWLFSRERKGHDLNLDPKFIWFCSVCTYTYINTREDSITVCPRCGSYNKK